MNVIYDSSLPVLAAWSLESPILTCMLCIQRDGNETRIIGSKHWRGEPLHVCIEDIRAFPWRRYAAHITPPDDSGEWAEMFARHGIETEAAPKVIDPVRLTQSLFGTLRIDTASRPWAEAGNNLDFIEALGMHAPRREIGIVDRYSTALPHTLPRFFVRALEIYAAWERDNPAFGIWHDPPDYKLQDKAVI